MFTGWVGKLLGSSNHLLPLAQPLLFPKDLDEPGGHVPASATPREVIES